MMANSSGTPPVPMVKKPMSQASIDLSGLVSSVPAAEMETCGSQRRERFVFRSNQLQILERSFADDNYPSYDRREDLAKTCNVSTQDLGKLFWILWAFKNFPREGVSSPWFVCQKGHVEKFCGTQMSANIENMYNFSRFVWCSKKIHGRIKIN